ncbi:MAG: fibronectin type III domain-containing protein [Pseudomonadota bacterium]
MNFKSIFSLIFILLTSTSVHCYDIKMSWTQSESGQDNVSGYNVYEKVDSSDWQLIEVVPGWESTIFTAAGKELDHTYSYKVRAFNKYKIESADSNIISESIGKPKPVKLSIIEIIVAWFKKVFSFGCFFA